MHAADSTHDPFSPQPVSAAWAWAVLAVAAAVLFVWFMFRSELGRVSGRTLPAPLSRLELEPLTGAASKVTLADVRGKVVLLQFWGTWCPPCREEFPHTNELVQHYRDRPDFQLLSVSVGDSDIDTLRGATAEFLREQGVELTTYADPHSTTRNAVDEAIGFEGYPTTLILDRQGQIAARWVGYEPGSEREMARRIDELLAEKPEQARVVPEVR
jgi:thiol-disulfide isomerase/thioredoxin